MKERKGLDKSGTGREQEKRRKIVLNTTQKQRESLEPNLLLIIRETNFA